MAEAAEVRATGQRPTVEVDCEHCGHRFAVPQPRHRKVPCPNCGGMTLVPLQRAPVWFLAVACTALAAIAVPGLAYRVAGPWIALPVALVTLGAVWWFGRRL